MTTCSPAVSDAEKAEWAAAQGLEPIAWTGVNWLENDDMEIAKLLARIRQLSVTGAGPEDGDGFGTLVTAKELERRFQSCPAALANADRLVERCSFQLLTGRPILPRVELAKGTTSDIELARLCHRGLAKKYSPASHAVIKRLEYELATVKKNGFSDYFLVVHEIVDFAKRNNIPVEVRGSAAGSLISHVLGFTRVCPVENRLYFERFMNPGRTDCPDIDVDFCWRRRDEVIRFCYERWGFERVAMVCNINRYRLRSAIRDVGRALGMEPVQINQLAREGKIKRTSPIYRLAEKLVDIPRHLGVHCGGIVVTPYPVWQIAPLERANKGVVITQYDKDAVEAVGLVKIDLLGNRSLSTVNEAIQIITRPTHNGDSEICRHKVVDSQASIPAIRRRPRCSVRARVSACFKASRPGMRQLLRGLKVKSKKDLAIALSLIRPGPASGGMKSEFIERHVNGKALQVPASEDRNAPRRHIRRDALPGGRHADRRGGRRLHRGRCGPLPVRGLQEGLRRPRAGPVRRFRSRAGGPRRASTARPPRPSGTRSCVSPPIRTARRMRPSTPISPGRRRISRPTTRPQFYCSLFNNHQGMYPLRVYVWDAKRHGVKVLPPHVNHSDIEWSLQGNAIRAGLNIVKGLSGGTARCDHRAAAECESSANSTTCEDA